MVLFLIGSILVISLSTTCINEAISYIIVYRTRKYKSLVASLEKETKKYDRKMEQGFISSSSQTKKLQRQEEQLRQIGKEFSTIQIKSSIITGIFMLLVSAVLNRLYRGIVMVKLPFNPIWPIKTMTHRGLQTADFTDGSAFFVYLLFSLISRQLLQRFLGFNVKLPKVAQDWMKINQ
jgi:uncharacterized membrane protein (DUF106 family)